MLRRVLSAAETEMLRAFKAALSARFGARVRAFTLFGSRARGGGRDDSDLDVLVALDGVIPSERRDVIDIAADLGVQRDLVLSPLVVGVGADGHAVLPRALSEAIAREGLSL